MSGFPSEILDEIQILPTLNEPPEWKGVDNINFTNWLKDNDTYTPLVDSTITKKMLAGVYKIDRDDNGQLYAFKTDFVTDELINFSDIVYENIINDVKEFWRKKDVFKKNNLIYKRGILLEGPPGTGKSALISLLINEIIKNDGLVFTISSIKELCLVTDFYLESLRKIEPDRNIITIIEDIDLMYQDGKSLFLDFFDGKKSIDSNLTILTTNNSSELDTAILRPSRIDKRYILNNPSDKIRREYFTNKNVKLDKIDELVDKTKDLSFAQLKEIFISIVIFDKTIDEAVLYVKNPKDTKNYLIKKEKSISL